MQLANELATVISILTLTRVTLATEPPAPGSVPTTTPAASPQLYPAQAPQPYPAQAPQPYPAQAPQPYPAQAPMCIPACRHGYECYGGQCISLCNPPCAAGEFCTPDRQCAKQPPGQFPYYAVMAPLDPQVAAAIEAKRVERERLDKLRQQWRPFVGAAFDFGLTQTDYWRTISTGPRLIGGVRRNFARYFGLEAKVGLASYEIDHDFCETPELDSNGNDTCGDWVDVSELRETHFSLGGGVLIGPFRSFYLNPEIVFGYYAASNSNWKHGGYGGGNLRFGWVIGRDDQFDLSFAFGGTTLPDQDTARFRWEILAFKYVF